MKTFLLVTLFLTSTVFARGVPLPTCKTEGTMQQVEYFDPGHFYMDFCQNDRGIQSMEECQKYFRNSDPQLLRKEMSEFLKQRALKVCGE